MVYLFNWYASNASWLNDAVELNERGEIVIDRNNNTNVPGIFAAGDVTDQKNKQIIISMGAGADATIQMPLTILSETKVSFISLTVSYIC